MLEKRELVVLQALGKLCLRDGYNIVDRKDIYFSLPSDIKRECEENFSEILDTLKVKKYIGLKFSGEEDVCLELTGQSKNLLNELKELELKTLSAKAVITKDAAGRTMLVETGKDVTVKTPETSPTFSPKVKLRAGVYAAISGLATVFGVIGAVLYDIIKSLIN